MSSSIIVLAFAFSLLVPTALQGEDVLLNRLPHIFERDTSQHEFLLEFTSDNGRFPRSIRPDDTLVTMKSDDWPSGFFPGNLWFLHEYDSSAKWKGKALGYTVKLEPIRHFKEHHDGGFMLSCSYGNALRLSRDESQRAVLRDAAAALTTRYVSALGMIRSWDSKPYTCPVIIDNMMNLEPLVWAAKNGGDPKLRDIAISHADQTLKHHFSHDGSAYHVVDYDPETGWVHAYHANQGADVRTPWARGQAWAIYGFTMMFRETGKPEYLAKATTLAEFCMAHPNLLKDKVPNWDYSIPPGDDVPRDASAATVMASALIELSQLAPDGGKFLNFAREQLLTLASPAFLAEPGTNCGLLLTRSTGHLPKQSEINVPLVYADYYFLEALLRHRSVATHTKRTSFSKAP